MVVKKQRIFKQLLNVMPIIILYTQTSQGFFFEIRLLGGFKGLEDQKTFRRFLSLENILRPFKTRRLFNCLLWLGELSTASQKLVFYELKISHWYLENLPSAFHQTSIDMRLLILLSAFYIQKTIQKTSHRQFSYRIPTMICLWTSER